MVALKNGKYLVTKKLPHVQRKLSLKTAIKRKNLLVFFFLIDYGIIRTHAGAGTALNTGVGINPVVPVKLLHRFGRTDFPACSADNAIFSNEIGHGFLLTSQLRRLKYYRNFQRLTERGCNV